LGYAYYVIRSEEEFWDVLKWHDSEIKKNQ
jgi:hypothetical protein